MDEQSKATLDAILAQEPAALSDSDKGFLRARRSYLSEEQKAVYADVLDEEPKAESFEPEPETEDVEEAPRRGRKPKAE